jgi:hypothetical protein
MHLWALKYCLYEWHRLKDAVFIDIIDYGITRVELGTRIDVAFEVNDKILKLVERNDETTALTKKRVVYPTHDDGHTADGKRPVKFAATREVFSRLCPDR